ncbi:MAG: hypothetical protein ACTSXZ_07275 [Alphaproteobacteria bacterium]
MAGAINFRLPAQAFGFGHPESRHRRDEGSQSHEKKKFFASLKMTPLYILLFIDLHRWAFLRTDALSFRFGYNVSM